MDELRHLAQSSYAEDTLRNGHTSVWGSFYDPKEKRWGYACCMSTDWKEPCPFGINDAAAHHSSDEEPQSAAALKARATWNAQKALDDPPLACLNSRESYKCSEDYLKDFIHIWFHDWIGNSAEKPDARTVQQTREAFIPLLCQLKDRSVPRDLLGSLTAFAELSSQREYSKANDVYIGITIGKALWHSHLDLGQQRAHWGFGDNNRTMQKQIVEKDYKNATLFDTDPSVQRYVHALKRLVTHMQSVQPSADPSKLGHVPAPAADPSELGLPVRENIRGKHVEDRVPEGLCPNDLVPIRDIKFGTEIAGHAHPFHGIGFARGI